MSDAEVLNREEVLALLSKKAREGSVSAAIALEREYSESAQSQT
jgi:hypothetical protein